MQAEPLISGPLRAVLRQARDVERLFDDPALDLAALDVPTLSALTRVHGVDVATALLFDRVRRDPANAEFLGALESASSLAPARDVRPAVSRGAVVRIVPAAFYREYPVYGGDGRVVRRAARSLGLGSALWPLPSTGSVRGNADRLARLLDREPDGSVILVSLSKGGADVRVALEKNPELARKCRAWVNVGGLIRGTAIVNDLHRGAWWKRGLLRGYLALTSADPRLIEELRHGRETLLGPPPCVPRDLRVINVIGFPQRSELRGRLRERHARLGDAGSIVGPNDGMTLIRDAMVEPGWTLPIWGADHYMRGPACARAIRSVMDLLGRELEPNRAEECAGDSAGPGAAEHTDEGAAAKLASPLGGSGVMAQASPSGRPRGSQVGGNRAGSGPRRGCRN